MRLLLVLEDLLVGGAQIHAGVLASGLSRRGWTVDTAVLGDQATPAVTARFPGRVRRLAQTGLRDPRTWRRLADALGGEPADLVVAVNQVATCVAVSAAALGRLKAPVVSLFHTTRVDTGAGWLRTAPFLAAARACAAVVFVSEAQRAHWRRLGLRARQDAVIANGVDSAHFVPASASVRQAAREAMGLPPEALVFGMAAAFRREKNHLQLVEALARATGGPGGIDAWAVLIGDGPTRPAVQAAVAQSGLASRVLFLGEQDDVRPALAAMDVGVLCSTAVETAPLFALEAMASGRPMVAPRLGGLPELVADGRGGLLFPPGDTDALCAALRRCADPALRARMGRAGRAAAVERFDLDDMIDSYAQRLGRIAAGRPERATRWA